MEETNLSLANGRILWISVSEPAGGGDPSLKRQRLLLQIPERTSIENLGSPTKPTVKTPSNASTSTIAHSQMIYRYFDGDYGFILPARLVHFNSSNSYLIPLPTSSASPQSQTHRVYLLRRNNPLITFSNLLQYSLNQVQWTACENDISHIYGFDYSSIASIVSLRKEKLYYQATPKSEAIVREFLVLKVFFRSVNNNESSVLYFDCIEDDPPEGMVKINANPTPTTLSKAFDYHTFGHLVDISFSFSSASESDSASLHQHYHSQQGYPREIYQGYEYIFERNYHLTPDPLAALSFSSSTPLLALPPVPGATTSATASSQETSQQQQQQQHQQLNRKQGVIPLIQRKEILLNLETCGNCHSCNLEIISLNHKIFTHYCNFHNLNVRSTTPAPGTPRKRSKDPLDGSGSPLLPAAASPIRVPTTIEVREKPNNNNNFASVKAEEKPNKRRKTDFHQFPTIVNFERNLKNKPLMIDDYLPILHNIASESIKQLNSGIDLCNSNAGYFIFEATQAYLHSTLAVQEFSDISQLLHEQVSIEEDITIESTVFMLLQELVLHCLRTTTCPVNAGHYFYLLLQLYSQYISYENFVMIQYLMIQFARLFLPSVLSAASSSASSSLTSFPNLDSYLFLKLLPYSMLTENGIIANEPSWILEEGEEEADDERTLERMSKVMDKVFNLYFQVLFIAISDDQLWKIQDLKTVSTDFIEYVFIIYIAYLKKRALRRNLGMGPTSIDDMLNDYYYLQKKFNYLLQYKLHYINYYDEYAFSYFMKQQDGSQNSNNVNNNANSNPCDLLLKLLYYPFMKISLFSIYLFLNNNEIETYQEILTYCEKLHDQSRKKKMENRRKKLDEHRKNFSPNKDSNEPGSPGFGKRKRDDSSSSLSSLAAFNMINPLQITDDDIELLQAELLIKSTTDPILPSSLHFTASTAAFTPRYTPRQHFAHHQPTHRSPPAMPSNNNTGNSSAAHNSTANNTDNTANLYSAPEPTKHRGSNSSSASTAHVQFAPEVDMMVYSPTNDHQHSPSSLFPNANIPWIDTSYNHRHPGGEQGQDQSHALDQEDSLMSPNFASTLAALTAPTPRAPAKPATEEKVDETKLPAAPNKLISPTSTGVKQFRLSTLVQALQMKEGRHPSDESTLHPLPSMNEFLQLLLEVPSLIDLKDSLIRLKEEIPVRYANILKRSGKTNYTSYFQSYSNYDEQSRTASKAIAFAMCFSYFYYHFIALHDTEEQYQFYFQTTVLPQLQKSNPASQPPPPPPSAPSSRKTSPLNASQSPDPGGAYGSQQDALNLPPLDEANLQLMRRSYRYYNIFKVGFSLVSDLKAQTSAVIDGAVLLERKGQRLSRGGARSVFRECIDIIMKDLAKQ